MPSNLPSDAQQGVLQDLTRFRDQLDMYTLSSGFDEAIALLAGYDTGLNAGLLTGFHDWLAGRAPGSPHVAFPFFVVDEAFPDQKVNLGYLTPEQNCVAVAKLFELLFQYVEGS